MTNLQERLYKKAEAEQKEFLDKLKLMSADVIIESAYEITSREDILEILGTVELEPKKVKALSQLNFPLSACYDEWQKTDYSNTNEMVSSIEDFASNLIKQQKNRNEPER